jgi:quercetin dioxygenase-like cupin family protein
VAATSQLPALDREDDRMDQAQDISLEGWNIVRAEDADWVPWTGSAGEARAKILGTADGYMVTLVEAQPGYAGSPHEHAHPEFNYVVEGTLRNQGQQMSAGDGYAATAGSTHTDFETDTGATYIVIFKI